MSFFRKFALLAAAGAIAAFAFASVAQAHDDEDFDFFGDASCDDPNGWSVLWTLENFDGSNPFGIVNVRVIEDGSEAAFVEPVFNPHDNDTSDGYFIDENATATTLTAHGYDVDNVTLIITHDVGGEGFEDSGDEDFQASASRPANCEAPEEEDENGNGDGGNVNIIENEVEVESKNINKQTNTQNQTNDQSQTNSNSQETNVEASPDQSQSTDVNVAGGCCDDDKDKHGHHHDTHSADAVVVRGGSTGAANSAGVTIAPPSTGSGGLVDSGSTGFSLVGFGTLVLAIGGFAFRGLIATRN